MFDNDSRLNVTACFFRTTGNNLCRDKTAKDILVAMQTDTKTHQGVKKTMTGRAGSPNDSRARACAWDERYEGAISIPTPALVLREWPHLLPKCGRALDLACGLGGNALWLAERGFTVSAWDQSAKAIEQLWKTARNLGLDLDAQVRDVKAHPPSPDDFDVVVVAHFLDRDLAPSIAAALRPGGLLFYQTFTLESLGGRGPTNPAYRLGHDELLGLFPGLIIRAYRAEGRLASADSGLGDLALLAAQRA
jgi:tellurite methyltransferase